MCSGGGGGSSSCSGSAGAGCTGCGGVCQSECSGGCSGGCKNTCNNTCTATCADNCSGKCNQECTGGEMATVISSLSLDKKFNQKNIQDISNAIYYEAGPNRRKANPTQVNFSQKEKLTNEKMIQLINNLEKCDITISSDTYKVSDKSKGLTSFGEALISGVKTAYKKMIKG